MRDYTRQRGLAGDWLRYWHGQGRALDALADLEQHYQTRKLRSWLDETLDAAFEVSLQVEGRTLAWRWLVRAHVAQYGWQRFYTSAETNEARMRKVAQVYPDKWRDFIRETAHSAIGPRGRDESIVFGHSRLVTFLVEVGQASLATDFTLAMSQVFAAELTAQPITTPAWAR
ncbi:hypothetical protein [Phenylobacterium sp.]|uniref:hypothetical protein n=1 Tax=Phenylobacterium sp. TaxID=1871053 RepID=UPI0025D21639|nr:hypothetical protein [Phenylobacterium sp.]